MASGPYVTYFFSALSRLKAFGRACQNLVFPPRCLICHQWVGEVGVCSACWSALPFVMDPFCARCGIPLPESVEKNTVCGGCLKSPPLFCRARAPLVYGDQIKVPLMALKYGDKTHVVPQLSRWMLQAGESLFKEDTVIVPVPLHWRRHLMRQYNQAALLARELSKIKKVPLVVALTRCRSTKSQGHLSPRQRWVNMKGAFRVRPSQREKIVGASVLLVDDVLTTGATLSACAQVLLEGGAKTVDVLTVARTTKGAG